MASCRKESFVSRFNFSSPVHQGEASAGYSRRIKWKFVLHKELDKLTEQVDLECFDPQFWVSIIDDTFWWFLTDTYLRRIHWNCFSPVPATSLNLVHKSHYSIFCEDENLSFSYTQFAKGFFVSSNFSNNNSNKVEKSKVTRARFAGRSVDFFSVIFLTLVTRDIIDHKFSIVPCDTRVRLVLASTP